MTKKQELEGIFLTLIGGMLWAFSGACGQFLFSHYPVTPVWLTCIRMLGAGIVLTLYNGIHQGKKALKIFAVKKDVYRLLAFSIMGILFCQFAYLKAIQYSNAGTATVIQYTGPVMIMIYVCVKSLKWPSSREVMAIFLAVGGTFLLATGGDIHNMLLSPKGLMWGLMAALGLAIYTLIPGKILEKWGSMIVTGYGMLIGGLVIKVITGVPFRLAGLDFYGYLAVAGMVFLGTIFSFSTYLKGVSLIGPVKAGMIASIEPVAAVLLSVFWLGTAVHITDLIGFVCILSVIFLLAKKEEKKDFQREYLKE